MSRRRTYAPGVRHCPDAAGSGRSRRRAAAELPRTPESHLAPPERVRHVEATARTVAVNLGRRYGIPTTALRYSIVQGPRQSVYNAYSGRAGSSACTTCWAGHRSSTRTGAAPRLRQHPRRRRANRLALTDERAVAASSTSAGDADTTLRVCRGGARAVPRRPLGPGQRGVPLRRHPPHHLGHRAARASSAGSRSAPRRTRSRSTPPGSRDMPDLDRVLADADAKMRTLGVVRRADV